MKKIFTTSLLILLAIALVPFVFAGTIEEDCTEFTTVCVEGKWEKHRWVCTEYEKQCMWGLTTNTYVDADTVKGVDVMGYINTKESSWTKDGSGISLSTLGRVLVGDREFFNSHDTVFVDYLNANYVSRSEYNALNEKVKLIETWAKQNGYENNDALQLECAQVYGACGPYCKAGYC